MADPINNITREDVRLLASHSDRGESTLELYQRLAVKSAIYPGKGTPFGLMYAALGLAEAGEVQNKVKKAFRDDDLVTITETDSGRDGRAFRIVMRELTPARYHQIIKELGGALWYIAAVCEEIGVSMHDVALANLDELAGRTERGTLRGDGDNR